MSYGAGERFITMLNHPGLMFSWKSFVACGTWAYFILRRLERDQEVKISKSALLSLSDNN